MYLNIKNISHETLSNKLHMECKGITFEVAGHYIKPGKSININDAEIPSHAKLGIKEGLENKFIELNKISEIKSDSFSEIFPDITLEVKKEEIIENSLSKNESNISSEDDKLKKKKG